MFVAFVHFRVTVVSIETNYCLCVFRKSPGEGGGDVIPTPAARPSLRDMHSPQPHAKSTIEEDAKRHVASDSPPPPRRHKEKVLLPEHSLWSREAVAGTQFYLTCQPVDTNRNCSKDFFNPTQTFLFMFSTVRSRRPVNLSAAVDRCIAPFRTRASIVDSASPL